MLFFTNLQTEEERHAKESSEGLSLVLFALFFIVGIVLCAQLNCMIENRREKYYDKQTHKQ
jgi:heme/copper-type cytochrome/quinol oxidase subunit 2